MTISNEERTRRRNFVGSSDMAAIMGFVPRRSPGTVYLEKVGEFVPDGKEDSEEIEIGNLLEEPLIRYVEKQYGVEVQRGTRHERGILAANLDGEFMEEGRPVVVEAKTTSLSWEWGEADTDEVPWAVTIQVHHQMLCANAKRAIVVAFMPVAGRLKLRLFEIERDDELCAILEMFAREWWKKHVVPRVPPPEAPSKVIMAKLVRPSDGVVASMKQDTVERYFALKDLLATAKKRYEDAEAVLISELDTAEMGTAPDGTTVTYKEVTRKAHEVRETKYRRLNVSRPKAKKGDG